MKATSADSSEVLVDSESHSFEKCLMEFDTSMKLPWELSLVYGVWFPDSGHAQHYLYSAPHLFPVCTRAHTHTPLLGMPGSILRKQSCCWGRRWRSYSAESIIQSSPPGMTNKTDVVCGVWLWGDFSPSQMEGSVAQRWSGARSHGMGNPCGISKGSRSCDGLKLYWSLQTSFCSRKQFTDRTLGFPRCLCWKVLKGSSK